MTYRVTRRGRILPLGTTILMGAALHVGSVSAQPNATPTGLGACGDNNSGISVPPGFCATVFADNLGHVRQLVAAPDGVVYANTWSGIYYQNDIPHAGGFLVALKDTKGDGHADVNIRFGETAATGGHGGTGIALYKDSLFAESNDRIVRYALAS